MVDRIGKGGALAREALLAAMKSQAERADDISRASDSIASKVGSEETRETGFGDRDRRQREREVHSRLGTRIQVEIRQVASIPREPNGKFRAVKSSVAGLES